MIKTTRPPGAVESRLPHGTGGGLDPTLRLLLISLVVPGLLQLFSPPLNGLLLENFAFRLRGSSGAWELQRLPTLFTYPFVHGGVWHLTMNCLWTALLGQSLVISARLERRGLLLIFFLGTTAGGLVEAFFSPSSTLVGASGGVFAFIGAFARFQILLQGFGRQLKESVRFFGIMAVITIVFAAPEFSPGSPEGVSIAWRAHLGGLVAGALALPLALRLAGPRRRAGARFPRP